MRAFGFEISLRKAAPPPTASAVPGARDGRVWRTIYESSTGAYQRHVEVDAPKDLLAFSALFSCVTGIASDIAKLGICLVEQDKDGVWNEVERNSPFRPFLRRPNHYQTWYKFAEQWTIVKLLHGNAYALKVRDARRVVTSAYILDPTRVLPLVTDEGLVYYQLGRDPLSGVQENTVTVPASEIFHDMMCSLWHPLVGISPLYACALSATMGNKIQTGSTKFFDNMSRPSGVLTAPGTIQDETAQRIKTYWEQNFTSQNVGKLAVLGDGLKYEAMTIPAKDAELIDQLKWTGVDVANAFHYPLYKLGGAVPPGSTTESEGIRYYTDCLQPLIESMESVLDYGLALPAGMETRLDTQNLMRMDTAALIKSEVEAVGGAIKSPNEARKRLNLTPVTGGESPMIQQQNYSLAALAKRDAKDDPFSTEPPAEPDDEDEAKVLVESLIKELRTA